MLLLFQHFAHADAAASQDPHRPPAESTTAAAPYLLTLSLNNRLGPGTFGAPNLVLNVTNATHHILVFRWTSRHDAAFEVDYKAASDDPAQQSGWKRLAPAVQTPPAHSLQNPSDPGVTYIIGTYSMRIQLSPGQQNNDLCFWPDVAMATDGSYRVKAVMTIKDAAEFNGPVGPQTLVRDFACVVTSEPIILRRTSSGFSMVPLGPHK